MPDDQARQTKYRKAIREALLQEWDPIGIRGVPEAQDEYDAYVPALYELLLQRSPAQKLFEYLWWLETEHMGLPGDHQQTRQFAERLARLPGEFDGAIA